MPIILTLTDDQALDIMQQIATKLQKNPPSEVAISGRLIDQVTAAVYKQPLHTHFYTGMIAIATGLPKEKVSNPLSTLVKRGVVRMICKGTWERIK